MNTTNEIVKEGYLPKGKKVNAEGFLRDIKSLRELMEKNDPNRFKEREC